MQTMHGVSRLIGGLVGLTFLGMAGAANANLIGDTVTVTNIFGGQIFAGPQNVVVQQGVVELPGFGGVFDIDIEGSSIHFDPFLGPIGIPLNADDEYHFEDLDWFGEPDGIIIDISVDQMGLSIPVVPTFDEHAIWILFPQGTVFAAGAAVWIDIGTNHDVPEPSTLALFAIGLAGLGFMMRRRKLT